MENQAVSRLRPLATMSLRKMPSKTEAKALRRLHRGGVVRVALPLIPPVAEVAEQVAGHQAEGLCRLAGPPQVRTEGDAADFGASVRLANSHVGRHAQHPAVAGGTGPAYDHGLPAVRPRASPSSMRCSRLGLGKGANRHMGPDFGVRLAADRGEQALAVSLSNPAAPDGQSLLPTRQGQAWGGESRMQGRSCVGL